MKGPTYTVQANRITPDEAMHERNASWCCAFVRYQEPATAYNPTASRQATQPLLIVQNDCEAITVSNPKSSYAKTCTMTMRAGEVYYPGAVSPGDWVFCWMSDYQEDIDAICVSLQSLRDTNQPSGGAPLADWYSGLKFFGRVISVGYHDSVQDSGVRPVVQTISAQSFTDFTSSVYYTETAQRVYTQAYQNQNFGSNNFVSNGLDVALSDLAGKFYRFFTNATTGVPYFPPPDIAIAFYLVIALGIDQDTIVKTLNLPTAGVLSNAILVPPQVAQIFGKTGATKLWQILNVYLGLQRYNNSTSNTGQQPWVSFAPIADVFPSPALPIFFKAPDRLKGWVSFFPVPWDNKPLWSILAGYLNPVVNEMYTVLRCDAYGFIRPSFVAREQPFGTHLFDVLQNKKVAEAQSLNGKSLGVSYQNVPQTQNVTSSPRPKKFGPAALYPQTNESVRAMYDTHPRWVIDETMITDVNVEVDDQNRVNFVQVWGRNGLSNMLAPSKVGGSDSIELDRAYQLSIGNMVADDADIQRAGLRANVMETPFDYPLALLGSRAPYWAKMRADWLFNGHLKATGTISLNGVREPICEGDNCQVRGVVYHINDVTHSGSFSGGRKTFTTRLTVSNGILADSLDNNLLPSYLVHQGPSEDQNQYVPGTTDVRYTVDDTSLSHVRGTGAKE